MFKNKYQISRVLKVFDGSAFEAVIDLGMGVYLKKKIYLTGITSPKYEEDNDYFLQAQTNLSLFLRNSVRGKVFIEIDEYHDDSVWGTIYTDEYEDSINWIMYLRGYVWDDGICDEDVKSNRELYVLNTPITKLV